jgi:hypothetical protein
MIRKTFMTIEEKIELNSMIRNYTGRNTFLNSLKNQLKNSKSLNRVEVGKRKLKVLSDKQYSAASEILKLEEKNK